METLRRESSPLSQTLSQESRVKLQKVVMVTAPGWSSTFQPTNAMLEGFQSKIPLPKKMISIPYGPITFMFLLIGIALLSLGVRYSIATTTGNSDAFTLKQALEAPVYANGKQLSNIKIFPTSANETTAKGVQSLLQNNVGAPNIGLSYGILPGYIGYVIIQLAILFIYLALMPFVLVIANMSKMLGMRNLQFIETIESLLFSSNKGYAKRPKFSRTIKGAMIGLFQSKGVALGNYFTLDELKTIVKKIVDGGDNQRIKILLKDSKMTDFVERNLVRYLPSNDVGKFQLTQDGLENAMDSYNLLPFDANQLKSFILDLPDFLESIRMSSFTHPILVQIGERSFKIKARFFWETTSYKYLKVPNSLEKVPQWYFKTQTDPASSQVGVREMAIQFQPGSGLELKDKIDPNETPDKEDGVPRYLVVEDTEKTNVDQNIPNMIASVFRGIGVFGGSIGSMAGILMLLVLVANTVDSFMGDYVTYDSSLFQKMVFVTSDAYYGWVNRSDVNTGDVFKMNQYIMKTNSKMKIIDVSKLRSNDDKIKSLIDTYNTDIGSSRFVLNQIFYRTLYLTLMITMPFVLAWFVGLMDTRLTFELLGPMGMSSSTDMGLILPGLTVLNFIITFSIATAYMSGDWFYTLDEKNPKPSYWETTRNTRASQMERAPMKTNLDDTTTSYVDLLRKLATHRFLTTSGNTTGSSLTQNSQQKRLLTSTSVYNIRAFERTRVLFITEANDFHGYYLQFISPKIGASQNNTSMNNQMNMTKYSGSARGLIYGGLSSIILLSIVLGLMGLLSIPLASSVSKEENNILSNGKAVIDFLFKYTHSVQRTKTLIGQAVIFLVGLISTITTFSFADNEVATGTYPGGPRRNTNVSELAYGSLAYIDENARPK